MLRICEIWSLVSPFQTDYTRVQYSLMLLFDYIGERYFSTMDLISNDECAEINHVLVIIEIIRKK